MGIFKGLFRTRDAPQNRTAGSSYSFFMGGSASGKQVNERTSMQMTAVYSCVRILSEAVASLPLNVYRYTDTGGKEKAFDHPLYRLLHDEPNPEMSSFVFRETLMTHLLLWGNAYAQIIRNGKNEIVALYPLMPNKMSVDRDENGRLYYTYYRGNNEAIKNKEYAVTLQPSEVLHIPGLGFDGLVGYSPIAMAKNAIGMAIACEEYGAKFFANVMAELPGIDYRCVITYKDESTGLSLTHPLTISFSRVVNGSGIVDLLVTTPNGNVFKNEEVASLTAKAELWRGSTVDATKVSYKWAVMDASVTATSSTGYDADFGIGWRKLSDTADKYTGTATNTLTVYAAAVDSYAVFKCCAQDTDSASASYNTKFFDVATFIDNSDPLQIIVTSTGGDVFKNGQGTTVLTAVCYQAGSEVDAAGNGSYTWTKYNKDGVVDTSWGTNGSKTGKTLSVSSADVDTKATFMVVVAL